MDDLSVFRPSNLLHTQEKMLRYRPGGFHPVCLGDTFKDGRYKIYHKLGWGGFSTVWLAEDRDLKKWVSVKIMTADSTCHSRELQTLQALQQKDAAKYIVRLFDSFVHQGPNGNHQCLVFELLGPTVDTVVADYHFGGDCLEPENLLRLTKQLLEAVASIHSAGYAHGDISGANIAFTAHALTHLSEEAMFEVIGSPKAEELLRLDGKPLGPGLPKQLAKNTGWDDWIDEDEEDIRFIDWGEAFALGAEPARLAQPAGLQAPEIIFNSCFDYRVDLWRTGCTIYSMMFGARPFQFLDSIEVLVAQMINFVEELPEEWQPQWELMKKKAGPSWEDVSDRDPIQSKLERKFQDQVQEPSLKPLLPIIRGLMRFRPSDRIEAAEALKLLLL